MTELLPLIPRFAVGGGVILALVGLRLVIEDLKRWRLR